MIRELEEIVKILTIFLGLKNSEILKNAPKIISALNKIYKNIYFSAIYGRTDLLKNDNAPIDILNIEIEQRGINVTVEKQIRQVNSSSFGFVQAKVNEKGLTKWKNTIFENEDEEKKDYYNETNDTIIELVDIIYSENGLINRLKSKTQKILKKYLELLNNIN